MQRVFRRRIELAVANPAARRHALAIARQNYRAGPQAVFVLEFAFENIGDDFHIAMRMRRKSSVGRDPIFVDHPQRAESHPLGIPIFAETEGVMRLEPAVVSAASFVSRPNLNHSYLRV